MIITALSVSVRVFSLVSEGDGEPALVVSRVFTGPGLPPPPLSTTLGDPVLGPVPF